MNDIPGRVFLDTNVVNFVLDHSECIFENQAPPAGMNTQDIADVDALQLVFATGQRAHWQLAVSPLTYAEVNRTQDRHRRRHLEAWFSEIWVCWRACVAEDSSLSDEYAEELAQQVSKLGLLAAFPDIHDQELICHAIAYRCDAFCTRDRRTILRRKARVPTLPIELLSPADWGRRLEKYAGLWL